MKRQITIISAALAFLVIMLSYQNCGVEPAGSMFKSSDAFPFPYDLSLDQVAYMSCSEQVNIPNDPGVIFSFRAGAYGTEAGIRLSEKFYYDTRRQDNFERKDHLSMDGVANTRLQFALRQSNALYQMFTNSDSAGGLEEQDFDFVLGDMGSDIMSASLLTRPAGSYLNYLSAAGINKDAYFEGTLVYNTSEVLANQVRTFMQQNGTLALGFSPIDKPATIRTPGDYADDDDQDGSTDDVDEDDTVASNQALGVGLRMTFKQPTVNNWYGSQVAQLSVPKRVLATVTEYNLSTSQPIKSWSCPSNLQFRIVFPPDAAGADPGNAAIPVCEAVNDPTVLDMNNADHKLLALARRSLPASDWFINVPRRCVIPKRYVVGTCYGVDSSTNATRNPVYWFTTAQETANPAKKCNPAINPACPHFVSICTK